MAFSLLILFTLAAFTLQSSMWKLKEWSLEELESLKISVLGADEFAKGGFQNLLGFGSFGNNTKLFTINPFVLAHSDYEAAWGRSGCYPRLKLDEENIEYFSEGINIGVANTSTDIEGRNGIAYLSADSSSSSAHDFFIIDTKDQSDFKIISSLNTGPGINALEIAGPYAFVAQASSVNQLQIIDIHNRMTPQLISQLRLTLPTPTTTAPVATSIFYSKGFIYLGSAKWGGPEFTIIDVSNINDPFIVGTFETNTVINDIYVQDNKAYLATADEDQLRVLDMEDKRAPVLLSEFSSSGWQTQTGKVLDFFEGTLGFGRTVGGFNVTTNHETFLFSSSSESYASKDIPGGVYGILIQPEYTILLTHALGHELQVWSSGFSKLIFDVPLGTNPVRMSCDGFALYFATGDSKGVSLLKLYE
ncbi:MAG: hypothetical protein QG640_678 [Patescibacteria group bacterium]|nr:hypothetical protein [Patescibacteria group bacterium]